MHGLAGKSAIVAGAGSGIGAATAARLAKEGASVVVADIHAANAEKVAAEIVERGGRAIGASFDIVDVTSVDQLLYRGQ
jgi:NAD(P)-dependent dehydrogenase (short-subunit alcohol dehydrogenase family)